MLTPTAGHTYTLAQIYADLCLRDSPFLMVCIEDKYYPIQTSHIGEKELASVPGFSDTKWSYQYETDEWIPIFYYSESNPDDFINFVEYERVRDWEGNIEDEGFWVTPKGFPVEQYYRRT